MLLADIVKILAHFLFEFMRLFLYTTQQYDLP